MKKLLRDALKCIISSGLEVVNIKIQLEKWAFDNSVSYKVLSLEKCCDEIQQNPLIDFHVGYFENGDDECAVALCETDTYPEPWEDYYTTDYRYYKINRCPFCGEPISIEIVDTVDKTSEYKQIEAETYELRKKINRCDSKKKVFQLEGEFREKNNMLNGFYQSGSIKIKSDEYDEA